jgi:hypothetical protein
MSIAEFENTFAHSSMEETLGELCKLDVDPDVVSHFVGKLQDDDDYLLYDLVMNDSTLPQHKEVLFRAMSHNDRVHTLLENTLEVQKSPSEKGTRLQAMMMDVMAHIPLEPIEQLRARNIGFPKVTLELLCCFDTTPLATFEYFANLVGRITCQEILYRNALHPMWRCRLAAYATLHRREC